MKYLLKPIFFFIIFYLTIIQCYCSINPDSLRRAIQNTKDKYLKVRLLNVLGTNFLYKNNEQAVNTAEEALELAKSIKFKEGMINSYTILGNGYFNLNQYGKALECYNFAETNLKKSSNKLKLAETYYSIAVIYNYQKKFDKAISYNNLCQELLKDIQCDDLLADCYKNYAYSYKLLRDNEKEINYLYKAIDIRKNKNNHNKIGPEYNKLASAYWNIHKYDSAFKYYNLFLKVSLLIKDSLEIARAYSNIGTTFYATANYNKALDYYETSLKLNQEGMKGHTYMELVDTYLKLGDDVKAAYFFSLANKERENIDLKDLAESCEAIANYYRAGSVTDKTIKYLDTLNSINKSIQKKSDNEAELNSKRLLEEQEGRIFEKLNNELTKENAKAQKANNELTIKYNNVLKLIVALLLIIVILLIYIARVNYLKKQAAKGKAKRFIKQRVIDYDENVAELRKQIEKVDKKRKAELQEEEKPELQEEEDSYRSF